MTIPSYLTEILMSTLVVVGFFSVLKIGLSSMFFAHKKNEIVKIESQISLLKLRLRQRLMRKSQSLIDSATTDAEIKELLLPKVTEIRELEFNAAKDFQVLIHNLIDISESVSTHIRLKKGNPSSEKPADDRLAADLVVTRAQYEKLFAAHKTEMLIILQIIEMTSQLLARVTSFNEFAKLDRQQKPILSTAEKIEIENAYLLHDIQNRERSVANLNTSDDSVDRAA